MTLLKFSRNRFFPALEEPLSEVSFGEWLENPQAHAEARALVISNDAAVADIACDLNGFDVIILDFPAFKDGRAYSQARLLRSRFGYTGEIRARGNVLRDQIAFMVRCGFNAFEVDGLDAASADAALHELSFAYQAAADGVLAVWRQRLKTAAAA